MRSRSVGLLFSPEVAVGLLVSLATVIWWTRRERARAQAETPEGSDADGKAASPSSLLRLLIIQNNTKVFNQLISSGAPIDERTDVEGDTALHTAAKWDRSQMAVLLLAKGANVDGRNDRGATPLHCAVSAGAYETARALLAAGAPTTAEANDGRVPYEMAKSDGMRTLCGGPSLAMFRAVCDRDLSTA